MLCNYINDYFSAKFHNDQENTFDQKCLIEIELPQRLTRNQGPRSLANGRVKHLINTKSQMQFKCKNLISSSNSAVSTYPETRLNLRTIYPTIVSLYSELNQNLYPHLEFNQSQN